MEVTGWAKSKEERGRMPKVGEGDSSHNGLPRNWK